MKSGLLSVLGSRGFVGSLVVCGLFILMSGCGQKELKLQGTPEEGGKLLTQMLEAWKDGKSLADYAKSSEPPIVVADEDWAAGATLKSFQMGTPMQYGGLWRIPVKVVVAHPDRGERERDFAYGVTLQPKISIIRADDSEF
ncbi:MAG TPA: hypothetical protein DDY91_21150 [Planctomycetaceae bacterium]|nr:hypothetical protein [Planctomycetaceae bacterium]